ncbi:unnamed protein product [Prunus armeniaca]
MDCLCRGRGQEFYGAVCQRHQCSDYRRSFPDKEHQWIICSGWRVTSVISAGDLELPSGDEEDEAQTEQAAVEATPSSRRKRKETAPAQDTESPPPPLTKSKRLKKRTKVEYVATEEPAAAPTTTYGTDEELREAFDAVEQEREQEEEEDVPSKEKNKEPEEEEEIPAEVIAESIALAKQQQEAQKAKPISSKLALFDDVEAEHSAAAQMPMERLKPSILEPVEQANLLVAASEPEVEASAAVPRLVVEVPRTAGVLDVMTNPPVPPIVALDKLEKLSSTPGKAKSKVVDEAMERDMDLLHRQNMASKPILEMSIGLARDVLNLHNRYEDLKPTFKTSEFCKATHEANLADYAKQKAKLDQMVGYKEAKATADRLEKQIEELQKQLVECREVQNRLRPGLSSKTKATFLVQNMVSASRPALKIAEASIHQGVLLQKELSIKMASLQETLKKLGF